MGNSDIEAALKNIEIIIINTISDLNKKDKNDFINKTKKLLNTIKLENTHE
jgi:hypothetical protein